MIGHLHCFFVVINEHESVIMIGLKVNHFFCDVECANQSL